MASARASLRHYAAASYAAVAVETVEEERVIAALFDGSADAPGITRGARIVVSATGAKHHDGAPIQGGFPGAIAEAKGRECALLVMLDWQHLAKNAGAYRVLRDALPELRARGSLVVMLAPRWELPPELAREVPVLDWTLPTREELTAAVRVVAEAAELPMPNGADGALASLLDSAAGLTLAECEGAMALAVSETGALDAEVVQREKLRTIKADGSLQVWPAARDGQFGGYAGLQTYLRAEVLPSMSDRELAVRGLLMVGVPGTGKSLAARVCGGILGWPVIRWDVTACKGSLVGETERRMREATARLEALAPAVVVVDEIEKAVGGHASSANTDSGVTLGQVGHLLTWLQEHTAPLFVVMTCNDYAKLPPELTRPGRIDAQFFLDVPSASERAEIAAIHLKRFGQSGAEAMAPVVAEIASDWTGAEIEGLVRSAARQTRREITEASLRESSRHIRPIVRTRASEITALRQWAREALRPASASETVTIQAPARQVRRMAAEG